MCRYGMLVYASLEHLLLQVPTRKHDMYSCSTFWLLRWYVTASSTFTYVGEESYIYVCRSMHVSLGLPLDAESINYRIRGIIGGDFNLAVW